MPERHSWELGMTRIQQESRRRHAQLVMNVQGWEEKWKAGEGRTEGRQEYSRDRGAARVKEKQRERKWEMEEDGLLWFSDSWTRSTRMWREFSSRHPPAVPCMCPYTTCMWFITHENHTSMQTCIAASATISWIKLTNPYRIPLNNYLTPRDFHYCKCHVNTFTELALRYCVMYNY